MPGFLHNQKQLSPDESNRTRFVTKTRWVIESGRLRILATIMSKIAQIIYKKLYLIASYHSEWQDKKLEVFRTNNSKYITSVCWGLFGHRMCPN